MGRSRVGQEIASVVEVVMLGTSPDTKGGIASVVRVYQSAGLFSRLPITYVSSHVDGSSLKKLAAASRAWLYIVQLLIRRRRFLLHVHGASRASFWRKTAFILPVLWAGKPVLFHLHGGKFLQFYRDECSAASKALVRYVLNRCTKIIVLSESWKREIAAVTDNSNVEVIANPVLPYEMPLGLTGGSTESVLVLGRLSKSKGIYVLLDAFTKIAKEVPGVRLVCGGDGDIEAVRQIAEERGLGDRIDVPGWVDERRRAELLAAASIYVLPSFAEGLPMSILEAMSAGLPVVATPVGAVPEVVTDGQEGLLVPAGDVEELSSAMRKLLNDSALRKEMGSRGREKFHAHYSAAVVLPRVEAVYKELGVSITEAA